MVPNLGKKTFCVIKSAPNKKPFSFLKRKTRNCKQKHIIFSKTQISTKCSNLTAY